mgnify:CR=1 FL=1
MPSIRNGSLLMLGCEVTELSEQPVSCCPHPELHDWLHAKRSEMKSAITRLVQHQSFYRWDESAVPFGAGIDGCLREVLEIGKEMGFRTFRDPDGYYGYIEMGQGSEQLAILCHVDVVPPGEQRSWFSAPFTLDERGGRLYGRGVQDNKGPLIAALYAMKALQESGVPIRHRIRLIVGTDEENLWRCIARYKEQESLPDAAFTPDSSFPVINAEKRLVQAYLYGPPSDDLRLDCGGLFNIVPDKAYYTGARQRQVQKQLDKLGFPWQQDGERLVVLGQQAHASRCDREGANAIVRLCRALLGAGYVHPALGFCSLVVGTDPHIRALLGDVQDNVSGKLTVNLASLKMDETATQIGIDMRVPVTLSLDEFQKRMRKAVQELGWRYEEYDHLEPLYIPANSPLVQTLCQSYGAVMGVECIPTASGGITYARAMRNCVPFGAHFPHHPYQAHMPNESLSMEDLLLASEIYAVALQRLQKTSLRTSMVHPE